MVLLRAAAVLLRAAAVLLRAAAVLLRAAAVLLRAAAVLLRAAAVLLSLVGHSPTRCATWVSLSRAGNIYAFALALQPCIRAVRSVTRCTHSCTHANRMHSNRMHLQTSFHMQPATIPLEPSAAAGGQDDVATGDQTPRQEVRKSSFALYFAIV
jgi:hypothetical protein